MGPKLPGLSRTYLQGTMDEEETEEEEMDLDHNNGGTGAREQHGGGEGNNKQVGRGAGSEHSGGVEERAAAGAAPANAGVADKGTRRGTNAVKPRPASVGAGRAASTSLEGGKGKKPKKGG